MSAEASPRARRDAPERREPGTDPHRMEQGYLRAHGISEAAVRKAMRERGLGYVEAVKMLNRERQARFWQSH